MINATDVSEADVIEAERPEEPFYDLAMFGSRGMGGPFSGEMAIVFLDSRGDRWVRKLMLQGSQEGFLFDKLQEGFDPSTFPHRLMEAGTVSWEGPDLTTSRPFLGRDEEPYNPHDHTWREYYPYQGTCIGVPRRGRR